MFLKNKELKKTQSYYVSVYLCVTLYMHCLYQGR